MSKLSQIIQGQSLGPPRVLIYGPAGVGKTTFAASAKNPIFIQTEDGADVVGGARFPLAKSFQDVEEAISTLVNEKHDYNTVVLDSLDWLETLIHAEVCKSEKVSSIEQIGYAKGYVYALNFWRKFLAGLTTLRANGMACVLIAHSEIKRFENPESEGYDRYQIKLHKSASNLCQEFCDLIGFATYHTSTKQIDGGFGRKITRAVGTGERVLRPSERPAFIAKSRYQLPPELPLDWVTLVKAMTPEKEKANGKS